MSVCRHYLIEHSILHINPPFHVFDRTVVSLALTNCGSHVEGAFLYQVSGSEEHTLPWGFSLRSFTTVAERSVPWHRLGWCAFWKKKCFGSFTNGPRISRRTVTIHVDRAEYILLYLVAVYCVAVGDWHGLTFKGLVIVLWALFSAWVLRIVFSH